ncbi:hypothetical protein QP938_13500 [Porticoccaceae bacterium LTM1]|nr:hypothetical protein QP938_13500 [Porticoccaceae bacterium LTM1]
MALISTLNKSRRRVAATLLMWLLFSGQLFCTAHASSGINNPKAEQASLCSHCCHSEKPTQALKTSCCETPSSFCCGEAKHGAAAEAGVDCYQQVILFLVSFEQLLGQEPLYRNPTLPKWVEELTLRRSDPPIHLVNCTFLD